MTFLEIELLQELTKGEKHGKHGDREFKKGGRKQHITPAVSAAYDSSTMLDSPIHGLSFSPIPMVVRALVLKLWIVQNGTFPKHVSNIHTG